MKPKGVVLSGPDKTISREARRHKLPVTVGGETPPLPYGKTLFVAPGTRVPWDLLPAAWHFLERWDCAVPLWRYGVNASDVGSKAERKRTVAVVHDLRQLLHSVELLFVRNNAAGQALVEAYREELEGSQEQRLAFLRALHRVKPRCCVLPTTWLAEVHERSKQDARAVVGRTSRTAPRPGAKLVKVEVLPGRFVKCREGDEEMVKQRFERLGKRRNEW